MHPFNRIQTGRWLLVAGDCLSGASKPSPGALGALAVPPPETPPYKPEDDWIPSPEGLVTTAASQSGQGDAGHREAEELELAVQQKAVVDTVLARLKALRAASDVWAKEARVALGERAESGGGGRATGAGAGAAAAGVGGSVETIKALLARDEILMVVQVCLSSLFLSLRLCVFDIYVSLCLFSLCVLLCARMRVVLLSDVVSGRMTAVVRPSALVRPFPEGLGCCVFSRRVFFKRRRRELTYNGVLALFFFLSFQGFFLKLCGVKVLCCFRFRS